MKQREHMMSSALFIGRFQPFHTGHLLALEQIDKEKDVERIIIGIGSAQYSKTDDNPYTYEERKAMIERGVPGTLQKKCIIVPIPDIHDESRWVEHVETITGADVIVYTGNARVKKLFEEKKYTVREVKIKEGVSGTHIRALMKKKDDLWRTFIPKNNKI